MERLHVLNAIGYAIYRQIKRGSRLMTWNYDFNAPEHLLLVFGFIVMSAYMLGNYIKSIGKKQNKGVDDA